VIGRDSGIKIRVGSRDYSLRMSDFSAADARTFREMFGVGMASAFLNPDLDTIAALVWLVRRKGNRNLTYEAVASGVNYANTSVEDAEADALPTEDEVAADPS